MDFDDCNEYEPCDLHDELVQHEMNELDRDGEFVAGDDYSDDEESDEDMDLDDRDCDMDRDEE